MSAGELRRDPAAAAAGAEGLAAAAPYLDLEGVRVRLGRHLVLDDIDLAVAPGEVVAVFGPNGAGKTTLLRVAAGVLHPQAGRVAWPGCGPEPRAGLGYVGHGTFLNDALTARENLMFFGRLYGLDARVATTRAERLLREEGLALFAEDPVRSFSRGMQQRLAVCRALLHQPDLLLLDEPWSGLDAEAGERLAARLRALRARGGAALLASHDFEGALAVADRYVLVAGGRLQECGAAAPFRGHAQAFGERYRAATRAAAGRAGRLAAAHPLPAPARRGSTAAAPATPPGTAPPATPPRNAPAAQPLPPPGRHGATAAPARAEGVPVPAAARPLPGWCTACLAVARRDLQLEMRSRENLAVMGVFGLLVAVMFGFAFDPVGTNLRPVFAGVLLIAFVFAGMLGTARSFARDLENDGLLGTAASPAPPSAVFYGKLLANALFLALAEAILTPVFFVLLLVPFPVHPAPLLLGLTLGSAGLVAAGTLTGAIAAHTRAGEVIQPLLALPLLSPVLIATVRVADLAVAAGTAPSAAAGPWYGVLVAFDLVYLALPALLFDPVLEVSG